jgi:cyclomaltodextrinase / maltogenic alpha-amylase / neopullulanase
MTEEKKTEERKIVIGGVYKHFKGAYYKVLTVGKDSENLEEMVIYISLYYEENQEAKVWVRPLNDFMGEKELENGTTVNRFEFIEDKT